MKKRGYLFIVLLLVSLVPTYAAHDAVVNLINYNPQYETKNINFRLSIENQLTSMHSIDKVNLVTNGISFLNVLDPQSWQHYNDSNLINWNGTVAFLPDSINNVRFNAYLNKVNQDKTYIWTVNTVDTNGDLETNTFDVTVLNDDVKPIVTINSPKDYSFVKNEPFTFSLTATDAETGIDTLKLSRIEADDNDNPQNSIGLGNFTFNLNYNLGLYTANFNPSVMNPNLSFLDFKIMDIYDNADNLYDDANTHHIYVDDQSPLIKANFDEDFATNNLAQTFSYNVTDNSFFTKQYGFSPEVACNLYMETDNNPNIPNSAVNFTDNSYNSQIVSDLNNKLDGNYNSILKCEDNAGFETSYSSSFLLDTNGPDIELINPSNGDFVINGTLLNFSLTDALDIISVWYKLNNENEVYLQLTNGETSIDTSLWGEGNNVVQVFANDSLNNINNVSYNFIIDNSAPNIALLLPNGQLSNATVNFVYNASDLYSNNIVCSLSAINPLTGEFILDSRNVVSDELNSFYLNLAETGSWTFDLECIDEVGLISVVNSAVNVDNDAPIIDLNYPGNSSIFDRGYTQFLYNVTDEYSIFVDKCELYIDNSLNLTNSTEINKVNNFFEQNIIDGWHKWKIGCEDIVNNKVYTDEYNFLVDTVVPDVNLNYNKLTLEKQLDSLITNYTVEELNKNSSKLTIRDATNNTLYEINSENQNLVVSGLDLGLGNFTLSVFSDDVAGSSQLVWITFEVVDNLAPKILSYSQINNTVFSANTNNVNISLVTDENANCRYSVNFTLAYNAMTDMTTTGSKNHLVNFALSPGLSYNYHFACSDGINTMTNLHSLIFSISQSSFDPGNGNTNGGGGGRNRDNNIVNNTLITNQTQNNFVIQNVNNSVKNEENNAQVNEQPNTNAGNTESKQENSAPPITGFGVFANNIGKYKKQSLSAASVIVLGMLGSYGFFRYRKYKQYMMHRPPFN